MLKPYQKDPEPGTGHRGPVDPHGGNGHGGIATLHTPGNAMVLLTIASVIASTAIGIKFVSPLLHVAAVFPFFYGTVRQHRHSVSLALAIRWGVALFATTLCVGVFVPSRVASSLFFANGYVEVLGNWLTGPQAPPPADFPFLLWGLLAFLAGSVISGGLIGFVLGSVALGSTACGALFLFEHGGNVLQIAITAVPIWQWALFACGAFCIVPASLPFYELLQKIERVAEGRRMLLKYMYIAGGCFVVSLLLRLTIAGVWRGLLQRWTVF